MPSIQGSTPDQAARDKARLSLGCNVVVEAGAGTGKTTLLTDRLLFLLLGGPGGKPVPIHAVVALTFTEKAAAEIKLRLSDRLSELASRLAGEALSAPSNQRAERTLSELKENFRADEAELLARARAALEDLDKAQIGTIHSFAAHLLRLYPVQAGVDPGFSVDEGEGFEELFSSEWARWLDAELGEKPPRLADWLEVLALASLDELEGLARELCSEKIDLERAGCADPEAARWLAELARELASLPKSQPVPAGNSGIKAALAELAGALDALSRAAAAEDPPLPASLRGVEVSAKWPAAWDEEREPLYERAKSAAKSASAGSEALLRRAVRLLSPFARGFRRLYTRRGLVSFDGLLVKARDLVRDRPEAREELKRRFSTLLIDEFQDTDPLQGELLLLLAEAPGDAAGSWSQARLEPGRLFVVGDPKQSIYRFRGADIAAYQSFTRRILSQEGAVSCDLVANFRSPAAVLAPVNAVFSALMREEEGLQAAHKELVCGSSGGPAGPAVEFVAIGAPAAPGAVYDAAAVQDAEARWIAAWIREHCGPGRERRYKDAAVLLRTSTPLPALLEVFKAEGIPYAVELERFFYGAQEIVDFLNVLRALDDPADRVALAGVLRSPLCAVADRALCELSKAGALSYLSSAPPAGLALSKDDRRSISEVFPLLRALRARVGRAPLGELVGAVLEETQLLEACAAAYHGQQTASNLLKLGRLACEASAGRGETLREFIERVARLGGESAREGESALADEHLDAVRLMTIHKAKGLEFPVVFLTNASSWRRPPRTAVSLSDWGSARVGLRLGRWADAAMARLEAAEEEREARESVRLLYVAMTRARQRLFVLGKEKPDKGSPAWRLGLAGAWPAGAPGAASRVVAADAAAAKVGPVRKAPAPPQVSQTHLSALWRQRRARFEAARALSWTRSPTDSKSEPASPSRRDEDAAAAAPGAFVGRLCHRVLQGWDFRAGGDLAEALKAAGASLERLEPGGDWAAARAEAAAVLSKFLASKTARELGEAEILGRELPFAVESGGAVLRGAIDLVYRSKGKLVVADYKTDRVEGKTLKDLKKRHAPQGQAYRAAVEEAMKLSGVEFRLIFLRAPELS
ncbi:MAG: UvrD-helicase domain-containing protein [Elusimicrobia bacterium]|nr:UvrD-helicase domain-containing protein [Elusimicrobiota bacterium]